MAGLWNKANIKFDRCFNSYSRFTWLICIAVMIVLIYFVSGHRKSSAHVHLLNKAFKGPKHMPNWMKKRIRSMPKNSTNTNFPAFWPHRSMSERDDLLLAGEDPDVSGVEAIFDRDAAHAQKIEKMNNGLI